MKRFSQLFAAFWMLFAAAATAAVPTAIGLRFARTGTSAESVTVSVVDQDGALISGAAATLTSSHALKATTGAVTDGMLCPNVNANTSPTIVLTFAITGLPEGFSFDNVGMNLYGITASGTAQSTSNSRLWNVAVAQGASASALSSFAALTDFDLTRGHTSAVWNVSSTAAVTAGTELALSLTFTKGTTNAGCYVGIDELILSTGEAPTIPATPTEAIAISDSAYYFLRWFSNSGMLITEEADGSLVVATEDVTQRQYWQLLAAGATDTYYIRNAVTGRYIQSCNLTNSAASLIKTGETPVAYYVPRCTTSSASVYGYYRLTSTDCDSYANTAAAPHGLNKDGASTNIIAWAAGESNTGSWWALEETELTYDLRPFTLSDAIGTPRQTYLIVNAVSGQVLEMSADGSLAWADRDDSDAQSWYFVGTSNAGGGFLIANLGTGRTINVGTDDATRWFVSEGELAETGYLLTPFDTRTDTTTTFTLEGQSLVTFSALRSKYARAAQIYTQPCATVGSIYIANASIAGDAALASLTYPLPTVSGTTVTAEKATKPSNGHILWTLSRARLARGAEATLALTLNAPTSGYTITAYADWNRDGIFEAAYELPFATATETTIAVPADAALGESRLRIRLTDNGLTGADDECTGEVIDFVVSVEEAPAAYTATAVSADEARGTVESALENTTFSATAKPLGNASFLYWKDARVIVGAETSIALTLDHDIALTAFFSPNTADPIVDGIGTSVLEQNVLLNVDATRSSITVETDADVKAVVVFSAAGAIVARSAQKTVQTPGLAPGTYIVKVFTTAGTGSKKVGVR